MEKEEEREESPGDKQEKKEDEEQKPEEQQEISYDYNELKSGPESVNISQDTYLELQYPCTSPLYVCVSVCVLGQPIDP